MGDEHDCDTKSRLMASLALAMTALVVAANTMPWWRRG